MLQVRPATLTVAYCVCSQVLVTELMTDGDLKADAVVTPALQACSIMLSASTEGTEAAADFLQHLTPSQKHLTALQRHLQVIRLDLS